MKFEAYESIEFERRGRVLAIKLNRPGSMNAINGVLHTELARVFIDAANDPESDVVLLTGNGRAFCAGGALLWPQLIGYAKAKRYLLTGDALTATEAERIGLVSEVVPPDQLDAASYGLAERLARGATKAIRWTKITVNLPLKQLVHSHFDAGVAYEMLSNLSSDHREAVAAFRERRDALFTGG